MKNCTWLSKMMIRNGSRAGGATLSESSQQVDVTLGVPQGRETASPEKDASEGSGLGVSIPVVGLGGSAGALEPFMQFFAGMSADSGAAFVVIQHLAPTHESLLPDLLARHTQMKVMQAGDGVPVEPNCVYVIPPDQDLGICDGVLHLTKLIKPHGIPMPIDFFLRSLAEERQERAVCVLFSGVGSDGTQGLRAVQAAGGLTIAQDPQTAQYNDLPRSAIDSKHVDWVLPPDQIPGAVLEYLRHPYVKSDKSVIGDAAEGKRGGLDEILSIVRKQTDCDFRCYKKHTILRRIERRMGLRHISDITQYCQVLGQDAEEVSQLRNDLLINVTAFFRDGEAFEELRNQVIAPLLAAKPAGEPLRVWVVGCSTGEEAYSLAILLMEAMAAARKNCPVQVFATDIDEDALQTARQGCYRESIAADISPERLERFFIRTEHGYQVIDSLRSAVVFAVQNLISDAPFSRMDLISCRNLLIYLDAETQTKLAPLFNFALAPGGHLFLGKAEGVGSENELFSLVSKKAKIFRRVTLSRPIVLDTPIVPGKKKIQPVPGVAGRLPSVAYADAIRQALLGHFTASVVLVALRGQILQFYGQTGKYLDLPTAEPNLNLLDIAKEGLSLRLRAALHTANDEKRTVVLDGIPITRNANDSCARVTITPVAQRGAPEPLLAVIFEDALRPPVVSSEPSHDHGCEAAVQQLENELRITQQDLHATILDLQSSNEEMRISNEEVVSTNEELQSTNEELETSKEELQSVNEELTIVNNQLQEKVEQLDVAYGDIANLLKSTQLATLFLDRDLRIKFFTPVTTQVLNLIASDTGRPVRDLSLSFLACDFTADAQAVAQGGAAIERDLRHFDGSYYVVRFMPYRTHDNRLEGVVVTFDNVTRLRESEARFRSVLDQSRDVIYRQNVQTGRFEYMSPVIEQIAGYSVDECLVMDIQTVMSLIHPDDLPVVQAAYARLEETGISDVEYRLRTKKGDYCWVSNRSSMLRDKAGRPLYRSGNVSDITERKRGEDQIRSLTADLEQRVAERTEVAETRAKQLQSLTVQLFDVEECERRRLAELLHDDLQQILTGARMQLRAACKAFPPMPSFQSIDSLLEDSINKARQLSHELSPMVLYNSDLGASLEWLARRMKELHGLDVTVEKDGWVGTHVTGWDVFLFRAVQELLFNVVKHARVERACVQISRSMQELIVSVSDSGCGFDPAILKPDDATGFGLLSIRERVQALGGLLSIESAPGLGSRFTVVVPLPAVEETGAPAPIETVPASTGRPNATSATARHRVLLVDDHQVLRKGVASVITGEPDIELVGEASNGREAIELTRTLHPTVVIMDISMPEMDGIEATRRIKQEMPEVRVIALSMFEESAAQRMRQVGAEAFVNKADAAERLLQAIYRC